jgi:hypothetical protein
MSFETIKTACFSLGIVLFSICITILMLPYLIYSLLFGENHKNF